MSKPWESPGFSRGGAVNNYWLAGLRTLTTEAAAEAAIAKLG